MSNIVVNIDKITSTEVDKGRQESGSLKQLIVKILNLISVDADGFCESKDWPYLWPVKHRQNSKKL